MKTRNCIFFIVCFLPQLLWSQHNDIHKRIYYPQRITTVPNIDGVLDDEVWANGNWETEFSQFEPNNGQPASQETEFCILFDDDNIYVGIRAFDTAPDSIVSRLTRRDYNEGDGVGIVFDSYHDLRTAFLLGVSAGGTRFDQIMTEDGRNEDPTWDPNWWARTSIHEYGWEAEMRIPFSQLRFQKNGSGIWGLQVFRQFHRKGELSFWQPIPADAPGLVHQIGEMHGMEKVQPRRIFDITPYLVTRAETYQSQQGNPFAPGREQHLKAGVDAKLGITNNLTLDMTINPDFGQVEADPSEVNLSAFETFFQEKRPFFIEGSNISSFPLGIGNGGIGNDNLFYSRRIGRRPAGNISIENGAWVDRPSFTNILGAAKLTGKNQDGLSLSIIQSVTGEAQAEIAHNGEHRFETLEPLSNYFVGRVQQDMNDGDMIIGGIFTGTHRKLNDNLAAQMHSQAYSGGLDFTKYFSDKTWMFNINAAMSHVAGDPKAILRTQRAPGRYFQRPDASHLSIDTTRTSLTGTGGRIQMMKSGSGHWNMMTAVLWKSPQFDINDLGYMREADQIIQLSWIGYRQWEPRGIYRSYNINLNQYNLWSFAGKRETSGINLNGFIRYKNYWSTNAGAEYNLGINSSTLLRGGPAFRTPNRMSGWFGMGTDNRNKLIVHLSGNFGAGHENSYRFYRVGPGITYKPKDNLNISFNPSVSKRSDELQYIRQLDYNNETRYIFASIDQNIVNFSFRLNYTITPDLTIQYWGQPFIASGNYYDFKHVTRPQDNVYRNRFHVYDANQIELIDGTYRIDENRDGNVDYQFGKPDFNFMEFLSNLVVRWEFQPGSSLFLVWSQTRSDFETDGNMQYMNHLDQLFSQKSHNIFLLKISYRFGVTG